jgi:hypothetical protein
MVAIRRKASLTQKCFKRTHMIIEPILNYCVFNPVQFSCSNCTYLGDVHDDSKRRDICLKWKNRAEERDGDLKLQTGPTGS